MPITRVNLLPPSAIRIPGPGPPDPRIAAPPQPPTNGVSMGAAPGVSSPSASITSPDLLLDTSESQEGGDDADGDGDDEYTPATGSSDPYANLDGAFGNYVADEPRPQQDGLLF